MQKVCCLDRYQDRRVETFVTCRRFASICKCTGSSIDTGTQLKKVRLFSISSTWLPRASVHLQKGWKNHQDIAVRGDRTHDHVVKSHALYHWARTATSILTFRRQTYNLERFNYLYCPVQSVQAEQRLCCTVSVCSWCIDSCRKIENLTLMSTLKFSKLFIGSRGFWNNIYVYV
jgi:hypothetical protein